MSHQVEWARVTFISISMKGFSLQVDQNKLIICYCFWEILAYSHTVIWFLLSFFHSIRVRWLGLSDMYDHLYPDTFLTPGSLSVKTYRLSVQYNQIKFRLSMRNPCLFIIVLNQCYIKLQGSLPWNVAAAMFKVSIHFSANYGTWYEPFGAIKSDCALSVLTLNWFRSSFTMLCDCCMIFYELCCKD